MAGTLVGGDFGSALANIGNAMSAGFNASNGGGMITPPIQPQQQPQQPQNQPAPQQQQPQGMDLIHQLLSHILGGGYGASAPPTMPPASGYGAGNYLGRIGQP